MKSLGKSKLSKRPRRVLMSIFIYILVFGLSMGTSFGLCYAYFSAKVEASGTVTMGELTIDYYNEAGTTLASNLIVYSERDSSQNLLASSGTVMPGDVLHIKGQIKNVNSANAIDCYTLLRVEVTKTFEGEGADLSYKDIDYFKLDGTKVVAGANGRYTTAPTLLAVGASASLDIEYEVLGKEVNNSYSNKDVQVVLTLLGYQTELIVEETYNNSGSDSSIYGSVGVQATHKLIGQEIDVWGDNNTASTSLTGAGTEANPYLINSINDLLYFSTNCMGASYSGKYFKITKHLDLNNKNWTPMSNFQGILDGDGYSILNLYILNSGSNVGFISNIQGATLKNIIIKNVKIVATFTGTSGLYVAPLVAYGNDGRNSLIQNCGVIGSSAITNHIEVTSSTSLTVLIGGLVGSVYQYNSAVGIENCYSMVNISASLSCSTLYLYLGGIIARCPTNSSAIKTIKNCYFIGDISVNNTSSSATLCVGLIAGGVLGVDNVINIENCFAISSSNYTHIGRTLALNNNVNNAYINSASQTSFTRVGVLKTENTLSRDGIKDIANLRDEMGWSVVDWDVDSGLNSGYPRLRVEK